MGVWSLTTVNSTAYPDELELDIERMAQGGEGVARWQGYVIFVAGGLPGERVRVRLVQRTASYARGRLLAVRTPAPERIAPRLPEASHMPWQHIAYAAQLRFKQTIVREQLARLGGLDDAPVAAVLAAPSPWHYRNTAHLHIAQNQQHIGYHAAGSRRVVDLPEDPLLLPLLNAALHGLRDTLPDISQARRRAHIERITLRGSATYGEAIALLHGKGRLHEVAAWWQQRLPMLAGVATPTDPHPRTLREKLGGVVFVLSPTSFFQVHTAQAERLLQVVRKGLRLQPGERLLDAYSGAGAFALPLAEALHEVMAIEEHPRAAADGVQSAQHNALTNVTFITAAVEQALPDITTRFDAAVLDPPRRGCHPAALQALIRLAPPRIAYISCHPGILARDLRTLVQAGYRLVQVQPVDMFPQTPHIESVALLEAAS
jgi:23S rRNA (uracil1939-C5)-methyltransferase